MDEGDCGGDEDHGGEDVLEGFFGEAWCEGAAAETANGGEGGDGEKDGPADGLGGGCGGDEEPGEGVDADEGEAGGSSGLNGECGDEDEGGDDEEAAARAEKTGYEADEKPLSDEAGRLDRGVGVGGGLGAVKGEEASDHERDERE